MTEPAECLFGLFLAVSCSHLPFLKLLSTKSRYVQETDGDTLFKEERWRAGFLFYLFQFMRLCSPCFRKKGSKGENSFLRWSLSQPFSSLMTSQCQGRYVPLATLLALLHELSLFFSTLFCPGHYLWTTFQTCFFLLFCQEDVFLFPILPWCHSAVKSERLRREWLA